MGVVYKGEDTKLDRPAALKFPASRLIGDEDVRQRFQRAAKASAAPDHPNMRTIHETDEADGKTFLPLQSSFLIRNRSYTVSRKRRPS